MMHIYQLFYGITIPLSNNEHNIIQQIEKVQLFDSSNFNENEKYIADELCIKGILKSSLKDGNIHYYISKQEIDREPLL